MDPVAHPPDEDDAEPFQHNPCTVGTGGRADCITNTEINVTIPFVGVTFKIIVPNLFTFGTEGGKSDEVKGGGSRGPLDPVKVINNADKAVIDPSKITHYALKPGSDKARVFKAALGYTVEHADDLLAQLKVGVTRNDAVLGKLDKWGQRFTVDMNVTGPNGRTQVVRTGWIYAPGSSVPQLTTAFVRPIEVGGRVLK